jgi:hypothetical protein
VGGVSSVCCLLLVACSLLRRPVGGDGTGLLLFNNLAHPIGLGNKNPNQKIKTQLKLHKIKMKPNLLLRDAHRFN